MMDVRIGLFEIRAVLKLALALSLSGLAISMGCEVCIAQQSDLVLEVSPEVTLREPNGGVIANSRIFAEWTVKDGRLGALMVRDGLAGPGDAHRTIRMEEPFSIEITGVGVLRASDMTVLGKARVETLAAQAEASKYSDRVPGVAVHYALAVPGGKFELDWAVILREGSSYIRQVVTVTAGDIPLALSDVRMIDVKIPDARGETIAVAGTVKGSPLTLGNFYLAFEQPLAESSVVGDHGVSELHRGVPLGAGMSASFSSVIGVAEAGQLRRAFLEYVERERAHPYRTFMHYNSWFDIGFFTPYSQEDALNRIHAIGDELHGKRGVVLDSYLFDDGWDDHGDLWKIRGDFKDGFAPLTKAAAEYGTAPGVWLSPWGGYGPPKQERMAAAKRDGYEMVDGGLALSGPKYYARFHDAVTEMVTKYGVNQFKLDGTGNADQVVKGSAFSSDFDAAIHLIEDLRKLKPDLYVNLTTGTYPSPFWLMYADSIWRGGDDTEFAGVGTRREQWITYRDADTYDEIVKAGRLFPLNSLMLHGIVYAQKAPYLSDDPGGDFKNEVRSYFGSGTQLQELYITPALLKNADWDVLAEAAKWSRKNAETLKDTHWIGGDPRWLEVYGWAAWSARESIITLRNPSAVAQDYLLEIGSALELPGSAPKRYVARSPWTDEAGEDAIELDAGVPHSLRLAPFQVMTLELSSR